jgi:hypothetical protein
MMAAAKLDEYWSHLRLSQTDLPGRKFLLQAHEAYQRVSVQRPALAETAHEEGTIASPRLAEALVRYMSPDPLVESVRAAITEDALEQALGRGRNFRRASNRSLVEYVLTTTPTNRPVDGTFTMAELKAATGWVGVFLEMGVWFEGGAKGMGGVLHAIVRGLAAQSPESLYRCLIGNPAFERAEAAADWRKKQLDDNPEIGALSREIDKALGSRADSIEIMFARYPLHDFAPVQV